MTILSINSEMCVCDKVQHVCHQLQNWTLNPAFHNFCHVWNVCVSFQCQMWQQRLVPALRTTFTDAHTRIKISATDDATWFFQAHLNKMFHMMLQVSVKLMIFDKASFGNENLGPIVLCFRQHIIQPFLRSVFCMEDWQWVFMSFAHNAPTSTGRQPLQAQFLFERLQIV